ncbi:MAG: phosphoglycerate dehydrogenase [Elusimicrobia bacterium]|nr:phosphoglycerate dehydrogenase [Elusimicrobiota bacterium]
MIKIIVTDGIDKEGLASLASHNGFKLYITEDSKELLKELPDADALLVRSKTKVNQELISQGKKLRFVGRAGVGVDNIDVETATKKGIVVANVPGGNTISAAEHTFALLLALARNVPQSDASVRKGFWKREKFIGSELLGKSLGLLGFGRIGREVAKRALAFGMKVFAYDPFISEANMKASSVQAGSLETILKESDYISLHLPITDETKKIINQKTIALMKPDARLINCARGELIDEPSLISALELKKIKGAALDVFTKEPLENSPFFGLENVILTPHLGASTEEAQIKVAKELSDSVKEFFEKGLIRNAVNVPSLDIENLEKVSPYIALAENLGKFIFQIAKGGIEEIKITFSGDFSSAVSHLLAITVVRGVLLSAIGKAEVNWVNALPIAKERGIRVEEIVVSEVEDYTNLMTVQVKTALQTRSVSGSILTKGIPRIVRIDDLPVDVIPSGHLLVLTNIDRPGVVGFIGTLLGQNQINIAEFQVGRRSQGGEAVSILNIDSQVSQEVIKKIGEFSGITSVCVVNLT